MKRGSRGRELTSCVTGEEEEEEDIIRNGSKSGAFQKHKASRQMGEKEESHKLKTVRIALGPKLSVGKSSFQFEVLLRHEGKNICLQKALLHSRETSTHF